MTGAIVLGWDGLDIELMQKFGLAEQFGEMGRSSGLQPE